MRLTVEVAGYPVPGSDVDRLRVVQRLGEHHACRLEFHRDPSYPHNDLAPLRAEELAGAAVRVAVEGEGGAHELFAGEVVRAREEHRAYGTSTFRVEARSASHRLGAHRDTRSYPRHTLAEVARALGVAVAGSAPAAEPLHYVQYAETDWAFLRRLADEHGCILRPVPGGAELRTGFADAVHALAWGGTLLRFATGAAPGNPAMKGALYEAARKADHRFPETRRRPEWLGGAAGLVAAVERAARAAGDGEASVLHFTARTPTLAGHRDQLLRESERRLGARVWAEGESTHPALLPGDRVRVEGGEHWTLRPTGTYGITGVVHLWDGRHYRNRFRATPHAGFTLPRRPRPRTVAGPCVAIVTAHEDPARMGRVRVRFPWQALDQESAWVRVAAPHAGNGRGLFALPEPGDEVLVGFEQGDPERPYVLGSLWNGLDRAPAAGPSTKQWVTRAGNAVVMSDAEGAESVELHTPGGRCVVRMSNAGTPSLVLRSEGDLVLEAPNGAVRVAAREWVQKVEGDSVREVAGSEHARIGRDVQLAAGQNVGLSAGASASLQAGAQVEAVSGGTLALKGATVQVQPPGHQKQRLSVRAAPAHTLLDAARAVPAMAAGSHTGEVAALARRGRGAGRPESPGTLELAYLHPDGTPVAGAPYVARFSDGTELRGTLGPDGTARLTGLAPALVGSPVEVEYGESPEAWSPLAPPPAAGNAEFLGELASGALLAEVEHLAGGPAPGLPGLPRGLAGLG